MFPRGPRYYSLLTVVLGCALVFSCGKKQEEAEPPLKPETNPQVTDLELQLQKQELYCYDSRKCPNYLTKIAIVENEKLRFCTGFLTEQNMVATSTTCLPERLQVEGLSCEKDIYFFFYNGNKKPIRTGCKQIHKISKLDGKYPYFWRSNLAYLELSQPLQDVEAPAISRDGMNESEKFITWTIDQLGDGFQGYMKSQECSSIHNSYVNPLASHRSSPVMLLGGCNFSDSNTGSPVLDSDNEKVRGVVSTKPNEEAMNVVLSLGMQNKFVPFIHVSNFACAPLLSGEDVLNSRECFKKLDIDQFIQRRKEMISDNILNSYLKEIEKKIPENQYLKLGLKLVSEPEYLDVKVEPVCFQNHQRWIYSAKNPTGLRLNLPNFGLKKIMDQLGKVSVREIEKPNLSVWYQFSPKDLRREGRVTVFAWVAVDDRNSDEISYPEIPKSCPNLLL